MDFQKLISENIIANLGIIRKTYRWIALVCLIVFWSIFIKESSVKILGIEIESNQISIVLYILITITSLYIIERYRRISILINQLEQKNKRETLFEVMINNWLLNPFSYQQNVISIKKGDNTISKLDLHINALKITFIPIIHIFMTLVLAKKQGYNEEMNMSDWLMKCGYISTTISVIYLLKSVIKSIDNSFISNQYQYTNYIILKNQKVRNTYFKALITLGLIVFVFAFYLGFTYFDLLIIMIKNIFAGNIETVQ